MHDSARESALDPTTPPPLLSSQIPWRIRLRDGVIIVAMWAVVALAVGVLAWVVIDLMAVGWKRLSWEFLVTEPRRSGRAGGIAPMLVSTGLILACCLAVVVPVGLGAAVLLAQSRSRAADLIRLSLDVLAGAPSIVLGLFGFAFFCKALGLGFSILAGGLTLACMCLPLVVRIAESGIRAVPPEQTAAAAALGLSRLTTLRTLILPAAAPALGAALALGIGRALAETAALIFTSGYVDRTPGSLMDSGRSLTVHIYDLAMNVPGGDASAAATALVLVVVLIIIDLVAGLVLLRWATRRITT
jgi:phosphate transport system permease protein